MQDSLVLRRTVYYREHTAGTYSVLSFWAAELLAEVPYIVFNSLIYSIIVYFRQATACGWQGRRDAWPQACRLVDDMHVMWKAFPTCVAWRSGRQRAGPAFWRCGALHACLAAAWLLRGQPAEHPRPGCPLPAAWASLPQPPSSSSSGS